MTYYCGIDPGLSGAIALLSTTGKIVDVHDLPILQVGAKRVLDLAVLRTLLPVVNDTPVAIERVAAMPGQGVTGMFRLGEVYGMLQGMLAMGRYRVSLVTPQAWKKVMMAGMPKDKDASRQRCSQLWPDNAQLWRRKKDHGRCDALLLAEWLRRQEGGNG